MIQSLAGKSVTINGTVTNFLGNVGANTTTITFSTTKKLDILDLPDSVTF